MRISNVSIHFTLIAFVAALVASIYSVFSPLPIPEKGVVYYIKPGTSQVKVIKQLSRQKLLNLGLMFNVLVHLHDSHLKSGEYFFPEGSTTYSIWKQITTGQGIHFRTFTIIPGWTFKQIREELAAIPEIKSSISSLTDKEVMQALGEEKYGAEGLFLPETYYYQRNDVDLSILKRANELMNQKLADAWEEREKGLPYKTSYEALIAASLVEKEAYLDSERKTISGVLVNRLHKNMLLQFDPTVIYGLGDKYDGKIYKRDLIEDTPYNTYVRKGLPPTPIAMPGMVSIMAALHPKKHKFLYFVARGDGSHEFSETLKNHERAVEKAEMYRKKREFNTSLVRSYLQHALLRSSVISGRKHASR